VGERTRSLRVFEQRERGCGEEKNDQPRLWKGEDAQVRFGAVAPSAAKDVIRRGVVGEDGLTVRGNQEVVIRRRAAKKSGKIEAGDRLNMVQVVDGDTH